MPHRCCKSYVYVYSDGNTYYTIYIIIFMKLEPDFLMPGHARDHDVILVFTLTCSFSYHVS